MEALLIMIVLFYIWLFVRGAIYLFGAIAIVSLCSVGLHLSFKNEPRNIFEIFIKGMISIPMMGIVCLFPKRYSDVVKLELANQVAELLVSQEKTKGSGFLIFREELRKGFTSI